MSQTICMELYYKLHRTQNEKAKQEYEVKWNSLFKKGGSISRRLFFLEAFWLYKLHNNITYNTTWHNDDNLDIDKYINICT